MVTEGPPSNLPRILESVFHLSPPVAPSEPPLGTSELEAMGSRLHSRVIYRPPETLTKVGTSHIESQEINTTKNGGNARPAESRM